MQLEQQTNYILSFADNLEIPALLKAVGIKHEEMEDDFFERIIRYVKIAVEVLSTKVFVFVNIRSYLTDEQIQELIKEIRYQEVKILFMENPNMQERILSKSWCRSILSCGAPGSMAWVVIMWIMCWKSRKRRMCWRLLQMKS